MCDVKTEKRERKKWVPQVSQFQIVANAVASGAVNAIVNVTYLV